VQQAGRSVQAGALAPGVSQQTVKHSAGIWIAGALRAAARITTRGETRLTGTMKHIPRTDWLELIAPSRGAPGEGVLSSPLACLSLLSVCSASRLSGSCHAGGRGRLPQVWEALPVGQAELTANRQGARRSRAADDIRPARVSQTRLAGSANRDIGKSLRTRRGRLRLPRPSGNPHLRSTPPQRILAQMHVRSQLDSFVSRLGGPMVGGPMVAEPIHVAPSGSWISAAGSAFLATCPRQIARELVARP
jgi:hypothetical protein